MKVQLSDKTHAWIQAEIAAGHYTDESEALDALVDLHQAAQPSPEADLTWAKPFLDEAQADIDAGRLVDGEQVHAKLRRQFSTQQ